MHVRMHVCACVHEQPLSQLSLLGGGALFPDWYEPLPGSYVCVSIAMCESIRASCAGNWPGADNFGLKVANFQFLLTHVLGFWRFLFFSCDKAHFVLRNMLCMHACTYDMCSRSTRAL
jgi:hypothetical protein